MKTSNKLLVGLFTVVLILMIIGNIVVKNKLKSHLNIEQKMDVTSTPDSISTDSSTIHINIQ